MTTGDFVHGKVHMLEVDEIIVVVCYSGPPRVKMGPGASWDRGPLNVFDGWKQSRSETIL